MQKSWNVNACERDAVIL